MAGCITLNKGPFRMITWRPTGGSGALASLSVTKEGVACVMVLGVRVASSAGLAPCITEAINDHEKPPPKCSSGSLKSKWQNADKLSVKAWQEDCKSMLLSRHSLNKANRTVMVCMA